MSEISFFTPIYYGNNAKSAEEKAIEIIDGYFHFTGKKAVVLKATKENGQEFVQLEKTKFTAKNLLKALGIALSIFTVIIPLFMLISKAVLRSSHSYKLIEPKKEKNRDVPEFQMHEITEATDSIVQKILKKENGEQNQFAKAQVEIPPEMRSIARVEDPEKIEKKLETQFKFAQEQAQKEPDKAFQYEVAPHNFEGKAHIEKISKYEVGVCHYIGRRDTMEDEHLATSFDLNIGGKIYPIQLFGIFDGHGGDKAAIFVKENLERKLKDTLSEFCKDGLTDKNIFNALKITFTRLKNDFNEDSSGTTATVVMILEGRLWTANVGDSRTILDNGIQLSEDAKPSDPRYQKRIQRRNGKVIMNRVNGILAVAGAIGDKNVGAVSARPKITVYPLSKIPMETQLILTCDGIYDVSSTRQVAKAAKDHRKQPADQLAKNIVYSAFRAYSKDNLSALVVKLT